ncbi:hypothetical protein F0562_025225 [Nyssa sinensis]|uniref:Uncharacterized protein n=1 Tax=Nyssa sinensis TaxID=561372 RepID=A0A5J5BDK6_9ASTE|nr:hypothetical protein F0562_025091 [Nyssa sinensis]KAA8541168.1 hypothetical protein F0562_025225 [Nyssa sinensis]
MPLRLAVSWQIVLTAFHGCILNQEELAVSELSGNGAGILVAANTVISTFLLVFVAEWGDKSFFSTIESYED